MNKDLANFMHIAGTRITGNIATLSFDIDVTGETIVSDNPDAPRFRLYTRSPKGKRIEIGAVWQRLNNDQRPYFTLTINTGFGRWYANLGRYPGQDDETLFAVIGNEYLNNREQRGN